MCPNCGNVRVRCWVSSTEANPGIRFYKCPNQRVEQSGVTVCDSWWWEDEYAAYITGAGINLLAATGGSFMVGSSSVLRELMATSSCTWYACILILVAHALRMVQDRF